MRARCYRCQNTFETDRFGTQTCPSCGSEIHLPDPNAPSASPPAQPPPSLPPPGTGGPGWGAPPPSWEPLPPGTVPPQAEQSAPFSERKQRGLVAAFIETWKLVALEPARFFRQVRISDPTSAVLFGVIGTTLGTWVSLAVQAMTPNMMLSFMTRFNERMGGRVDALPFMEMLQHRRLGLVAAFVATPVLWAILIFLTAGVFHLFLLVVRGAPRGFGATLTLVGYAHGIFLIDALPFCGGLIAMVWFCYVAVQGLMEVQRVGLGKAAFAVFMPVVLLCVCGCVAGLAAGMAASLAGGHPSPPPSIGL